MLGKAEGNVRTCPMGLPVNLLWSMVQQELKRCFSELSTAAHAAVSLNTQKPNSACIYMPQGIVDGSMQLPIKLFERIQIL